MSNHGFEIMGKGWWVNNGTGCSVVREDDGWHLYRNDSETKESTPSFRSMREAIASFRPPANQGE